MEMPKRDYSLELKKRVCFLKEAMNEAHASGLVFGNSGGKDSALVGILCKKATDNVLAIALPCKTQRNFSEDMDDAIALSKAYDIPMEIVNLTQTEEELIKAISSSETVSDTAKSNIAPRLRMTTLYTVAQSRNALVVGTGNRSEIYMGYFTKWGDGAYDINPIADLTVYEIYEFLEYLGAPENIIKKSPSAGLYEGQTDEGEMGVKYSSIDSYIISGDANEHDKEIIEHAHRITEHKRQLPKKYVD